MSSKQNVVCQLPITDIYDLLQYNSSKTLKTKLGPNAFVRLMWMRISIITFKIACCFSRWSKGLDENTSSFKVAWCSSMDEIACWMSWISSSTDRILFSYEVSFNVSNNHSTSESLCFLVRRSGAVWTELKCEESCGSEKWVQNPRPSNVMDVMQTLKQRCMRTTKTIPRRDGKTIIERK